MACSIKSTQSKLVGALIIILVASLIIICGFWATSSAPSRILQFEPDFGDGSVIKFNMYDEKSAEKMTMKIDKLLKTYEYNYNEHFMSKVVRCDFNNPPPNGMFCDIDIRAFGPCSKENYYGYKNGRPCVFLKLSTNPSWTPEFYDASHLPETMPDDLKNHIMNAINGDPLHTNFVWVSCGPKNESETFDVGSIQYFNRGFAGYYFPCTSEPTCISPLVAVYFERPRARAMLNIECKTWAQNLQETVEFKLFIE